MLDFIVSNLPILLSALAGMALIVVEAFMPGFGLPGISGIALSLVAVGLTASNHGAMAALGVALLMLAVTAVAVVLGFRSAARGRLAKSQLVLSEELSSEAGYDSITDVRGYLGRSGVTRTALRPVGVAEFDGARLEVVTEGDFIEKEQPVTVVLVEGMRVVVRRDVD